MIRITTTRTLHNLRLQREDAETRAATAYRHLRENVNQATREVQAATHRTSAAEEAVGRARAEYRQLLALAALVVVGADQRAREAEATADRFSTELNRLARAVHLAASRPVEVFIVLRDGRVHGVHATEHAAFKQAESDPDDPAPKDCWGDWSPGVDSPTGSRWRVLKVPVHGLFAAVQAEAAAVHGTAAGVHDARGAGGRDG
ncbi:hypothetical protein [Streptomyces lonarensis]|uniref:Uncharacterized protein n=1 Tax=Streptomyces lonarensis TaxID=700599 RepID=A0A7X6HYE7_9ACTN|nr:hypothetical protein [Streptomyces lonarensis]NJQ05503.1 hypothetical protein [Streptomyces lonarensis]